MQNCSSPCSFGLLLGRILLSFIFILSGIFKFVNYDSTVQMMAAKGMTLVPFFLVTAALLEIVGGIFILIGFYTRIGALLLLIFILPTTLIFHDFWNVQGSEMEMQMSNFLKNVAIMGGLLYVACTGAGKLSIDRCMPCNTKITG